MLKLFMIVSLSASLVACGGKANFLEKTSEARLNQLFREGVAKHNQVHRTNCRFLRYNPPTETGGHTWTPATDRDCWTKDTSIIWNTVHCALGTGSLWKDCSITDYPDRVYAYVPDAPDVNVILEEPRNRGPVICNTIGSSTICNQH